MPWAHGSATESPPWAYLPGADPHKIPIDPNGNLASKSEGPDSWGYEWNANNELARVTKNGLEQARFGYDPLGRRVEKVAGGVTTSYTYDHEDILREVRGATALRYVHALGVDEPLGVDDGMAPSYFHADALGSVVKVTNAAGVVTLARQYDAWGNLQAGASEPGYAFTGREWDPDTGLHYYRARYYDAGIGRFVREDPLPIEKRWLAEVNGYGYAAENPATWTDPLGWESGGAYRSLWCLETGKCGPKPKPPGACGSGWNEPFVPDGMAGVSFKPCCEVHDKCYGKCGKRQECCDIEFAGCLDDACKKAGKASSDPARPTFCQLMAAQYWGAVRMMGGGAYNDGQRTGCGK